MTHTEQLTAYFGQHAGVSAANTYRTLSRFDTTAKQLAQAITGEPVKTLGVVYRLHSACFALLTADEKRADAEDLENMA